MSSYQAYGITGSSLEQSLSTQNSSFLVQVSAFTRQHHEHQKDQQQASHLEDLRQHKKIRLWEIAGSYSIQLCGAKASIGTAFEAGAASV